jgi:hypothetical protein
VRYRLLSEPELSNLLKTTISNSHEQHQHNSQLTLQQQAESPRLEESSSDLDMPNGQNNCTTTTTTTACNDKKSQNRNNNNLVQTT